MRSDISLGQMAAGDKSNEITVFPELIEQINVRKAIVTLDTAGCQREDIYNLAGGVHDDFTIQQSDKALLRGHFRAAGLDLDSVRRGQ